MWDTARREGVRHSCRRKAKSGQGTRGGGKGKEFKKVSWECSVWSIMCHVIACFVPPRHGAVHTTLPSTSNHAN
jgi:hypothetical protein